MTREVIVVRNVVIAEHMGDPAGYCISYDDERWFVVFRVVDGARIGRFESRVQALAAAEVDRLRRS